MTSSVRSTTLKLQLALILFAICYISFVDCLRVRGSYSSREFFKFVAKFGFQRTSNDDRIRTRGYIFGNISLTASQQKKGIYSDPSTQPKLVVLDGQYMVDVLSNFRIRPQRLACEQMMNRVSSVAWDAECNANGVQDLSRSVPCAPGRLCPDEDTPANVVPRSQFTFVLQSTVPRFWYVSLISCYRSLKTNCTWRPTASPTASGTPTKPAYEADEFYSFDYDIELVNGHPLSKHLNPLEHHFSYEQHDTFEIYVGFLLIFALLLVLQARALSIYASAFQCPFYSVCDTLKCFSISNGIDLLWSCARIVRLNPFCTALIGYKTCLSARNSPAANAASLAASDRSEQSDRFPSEEASFKQVYKQTELNYMLGLVRALLATIALMAAGLLLCTVHTMLYAMNGSGVPQLPPVAGLLTDAAESAFVLLLVLVARGWCVLRARPADSSPAVLLYVVFIGASVAVAVVNLCNVDALLNVDQFQTSAFVLFIGLRLLALLYFVYSLYLSSRAAIALHSHSPELSDADEQRVRAIITFYDHFGAGFLAWLLVFPITVLICEHLLSPFSRLKAILGALPCSTVACRTSHLVHSTLYSLHALHYYRVQCALVQYTCTVLSNCATRIELEH